MRYFSLQYLILMRPKLKSQAFTLMFGGFASFKKAEANFSNPD